MIATLESAGIFEQERLELVDGELITKMGKNRPRVISAMLMLEWLQATSGKRYVNVEAPIDVNAIDNPPNEPVPDLIVVKNDYSTTLLARPLFAGRSLRWRRGRSFRLAARAIVYASSVAPA